MTEIRDLCAAASDAVEKILQAPLHDPAAPAGYLTKGFIEAETHQRHAAARAVTDRVLATIKQLYGPLAGASAREHLGALTLAVAETVTVISRSRRDPQATGERVLAALDAGRAKANAVRKREGRAVRDIVQTLAEEDAKKGYPAYGRASRIASKLKSNGIGRTTVYRHFQSLQCGTKNMISSRRNDDK